MTVSKSNQSPSEAQVTRKLTELAERVQKNVEVALQQSAEEVAAHARLLVTTGDRSGRLYTEGDAQARASAPGEPPLSRSGMLSTSIRVEEDPHASAHHVVATSPHARYLEFGTTSMAPRPFLQPALDEYSDRIDQRIKKAIQNAIKDGESLE